MRLSDFWLLMDDEFDPSYARSVAAHHAISTLGHRTVDEALAAGIAPRLIWAGLVSDFEIPPERQLGRDRPIKESRED